jgi:hypothetical protein
MKSIFFLIFLYSVISAENAVNKKNCKEYSIDIVYNKRNYIADLFNPCTYRIGPQIQDCKDVQEIVNKLQRSPYNVWQSNKEEFWRLFFSLTNVNIRSDVDKIKGVLPNDTVLTEIYVKALAYENSQKVQQEAFSILTEYTPYTLLNKYSPLIKDVLCASSITQSQKNLLYSYCNPEPTLRNKLLADSTLPVSARIRLGDKAAENELIDKFNATVDFKGKEKIVAQLADAGTEKCLHVLIRTFNKPIYEYGIDSCIFQSIGISIIKGFQRHLPDDPNFNKKYMGFLTTNYVEEKDFPKYPFFAQYFKDVMAAFKMHYGIMPDDTTFIPEMKGRFSCNRPY